MSDCLFCKILAGDIASDKVTETDNTYAFRDIQPVASTHVLVIPRDHIESADTVGPQHGALLAEMITTAQQIARSEGVDQSGYRLVFNVGDDANNTVPHLHLHVIGGRRMGWPPG